MWGFKVCRKISGHSLSF